MIDDARHGLFNQCQRMHEIKIVNIGMTTII